MLEFVFVTNKTHGIINDLFSGQDSTRTTIVRKRGSFFNSDGANITERLEDKFTNVGHVLVKTMVVDDAPLGGESTPHGTPEK